MQFFSRHSYIWKFDKEQEAKYEQFIQPSNLTSLRLVTFITILGMSIFLIIDFFREVDFSVVLATRIGVLTIASIIMWISYKKLSFNTYVFCITLIAAISFGSALITATFANMPPFYLTNLLFLLFLLSVTASGLHLRHAFFVNLTFLLTFLFYAEYVNRIPFYYSQYPHLFSIFIYIHIAGVVLESRRRNNFLQYNDLVDQKVLVEELNQQKNKVISILSHDIAAPMNSLSTILYLQSRDKISEQDLKSTLKELSDEFNNVSFLLHSLVRWSRSQMQGFVLDKTTVSMLDLLENKIKLFHLQLIDKDLELKVNVDQSAFVRVDEDMIRIALRNLISNAIKFARNGTKIQLEVSRNENNRVHVLVTNRGNPIPSDLKEKLFTYQMPSTPDSRGEKGAGLGLAISAFFVRLNGGDIYLAPSEDGATAFCMELPEEVSA
ncbi:MAG TPA: HAMP domain-containing sensor histidine kinase [Cyclobacteriaceae bacterium]|nr:HAMP domain-containing sensor histidine kinase [Cyclobacteriaceae bacterium]